MLTRRAVVIGLPLALAACGGQAVWAPDAAVAGLRYRHPGPSRLSLYTSRNNESRNGAHTGLLINASERVMFDPAGSFSHPAVAERNDVLFGFTPEVEAAYSRFQASARYHAIKLHMDVTPEIAEAAYQRALVAGPVAKAMCTRATVELLRGLSGFEGLGMTWLPDNLMRQFARLPGVTAEFVYTDDDGHEAGARATYEAEVLAVGAVPV